MSAPFAAFPWIKVDPNLIGHPKIKILSEELGIDEWSTLGKWIAVLGWCAKYSTDGVLSKYPYSVVCKYAGWDGDPEFFVKSMIKSDLCDSESESESESESDIRTDIVLIHNWELWHGDVLMSRAASDARSDSSKKANHIRWHVGRQVISPDCEYCIRTDIRTESESESGADIHRGEDRKRKRRGEDDSLLDPEGEL